jgi:hypothetical protein
VPVIAAGCGFFSSEPERQWYKPDGRYTVDEFKRDKAACTLSRKVDVECMKAKGWVYFSADVVPEVSPKPETGSMVPIPGKR